jgi:hypothetical protein
MTDPKQTHCILDRSFSDEDVLMLKEPRRAAVAAYESGRLQMVPDLSVECYPGQEFVKLPPDVLVLNPVGVAVEMEEPNKFYLSIDNQEGLYHLLCCDEFPGSQEVFTDF